MLNLPFFSVIIPTYNRAGFLPTAIESVLAQSYENWELIIVDDGSIDETSEVVEKYLPDRRIKYYWQENSGRSTARNTGCQSAIGAYLCYLDDDDFFLPHHLEIIKGCILNQSTQCIVRTEAFRVHSDGTKHQSPLLYLDPVPYDHIFLHGSGLIFYAFPQKLALIQSFAPYLSTGEDWHYILRAITRYPIAFTQQISAVFHYSPMLVKNQNSVHLFLRWQSLFQALEELKAYKSHLSTSGLWQKKKARMVRQALFQSIYLFDWPLFSLSIKAFFSMLLSQHFHKGESR